MCTRATVTNLRPMLAAAAVIVSAGCGSSPITSSRIERAIAPTFANLIHLQVSSMGLPPIAASDFAVRASCRKLMAGSSEGYGEWVCTLVWQGREQRTRRDTFDLFVTTDGCYTASIEGDSLGGPTLKTPEGSDVRNLLYTFEGCFDTT